MALFGGVALLGATTAMYAVRKIFGKRSSDEADEEIKSDLPVVEMPGIVSDIDGVVVKGPVVIPGT